MSCQCAWCGSVMGHKAPEEQGVTHGICSPCAAQMLADLDQWVPSEAEELAFQSECN